MCNSITITVLFTILFLSTKRYVAQVTGNDFNTTVKNNITEGRELEIDGLQPDSEYLYANLF